MDTKNRGLKFKLSLSIIITIMLILLITGFVLVVKETSREQVFIGILLIIASAISSPFISSLFYFYYRKEELINNKNLFQSISSIETIIDKKLGYGIINYNSNGIVFYISTSLIDDGFRNFFNKKISKVINLESETLSHNNKIYSINHDEKTSTILLKDITDIKRLEQYIDNKQQSTAVVKIEYSNKLKSNEVDNFNAQVSVNRFFEEWAQKNNGIYRQSGLHEESSLIIAKWQNMKIITHDDGKPMFVEINKLLGKNKGEVSISLGISYGNYNFKELLSEANNAVQIAQNRGGDQIVLQLPDGNLNYIGKSSISEQENSKIRIKFFFDRLSTNISKSNEVFITSHLNADVDSLGSTYGILKFVEEQNGRGYIILPDLDKTSTILFKKIPQADRKKFINEEEAKKMLTKKSMLIVCDVASKNRTQTDKLFDSIPKNSLFIIDHHRVGIDAIEFEESNAYIQTQVSSTSEIVTELFNFLNERNAKSLNKLVATLLLGGIYLDTRVLTKNVSSRTFENLTFLLNNHADQEYINNLFKLRIDDIAIFNNALKNAIKITNNVMLIIFPENQKIENSRISILADQLLNYRGIEASFVLAKTDNNMYKLSARSNNKYNVQIVCEQLGGGGHFNMAAAVWKKSEIRYITVQKRVQTAIMNVK